MSEKDKIKALKAAVESFSAVFGKSFCDVSEVLKRFEDVQADITFDVRESKDIENFVKACYGEKGKELRDLYRANQLVNCNKRIKNQRKELARLNELNDRARGEIVNLRDKNKQLNKLRVELLGEVDDLKNKLEMSESCDFSDSDSDRIKQLEDEREQLINAAESAIDCAGRVSELFKLSGRLW